MGTAHQLPEPGTPEWDESIALAVRAKLHDDAVTKAYAAATGESASSWTRIDLHDAIYGDHPDITPTVLQRNDTQALGYSGLTHSIHGPAGSGKTWFMLCAVAQELAAGRDVLYLDYESFPVQIVKRLKLLGVSGEKINKHLHYYRPQAAPDALDVDSAAFAGMLNQSYSLAVIDGANISMALCGLNPDVATDVARWHAAIMLPIAERTGAATFAVDHVPKNSSAYSGFAIGSQHKVAGLTGAAFVAEKMEPFGRGAKGYATLRVSPEKDREGFVHGIGLNDGQPDGLLVAELHIDATDTTTTIELRPPTDETVKAVADKRNKHKGGKTETADITYEMELISSYWDEALRDPKSDAKERSQNKTVDTLLARQKASPSDFERALSRDALKLAVRALIDPKTPGGPYAELDESITLRGGSHPHRTVTLYQRGSLDAKLSKILSQAKVGRVDDDDATTGQTP